MGRQLQFYVYFTIKMTNKGDQKWVTASRLCKFCYRDGKQDCSGIGGQLQLYAPFYYQDGKQSSQKIGGKLQFYVQFTMKMTNRKLKNGWATSIL